jgi:hypothetical protein
VVGADLEEIGLRVKHMNIVSNAQGYVLHQKGTMLWDRDPVAAQRFLNMGMSCCTSCHNWRGIDRLLLRLVAVLKYEEALDTNPADERALTNIAEIGLLQMQGFQRAVAEITYDWNDVCRTPPLQPQLDWVGLDWIGLDWIGLDWIGLEQY